MARIIGFPYRADGVARVQGDVLIKFLISASAGEFANNLAVGKVATGGHWWLDLARRFEAGQHDDSIAGRRAIGADAGVAPVLGDTFSCGGSGEVGDRF